MSAVGKGRRAGQRRIEAPAANLCAITDVGLVRDQNEDDFHAGARGRLLMVADGLGGLPGGEVASRTAVEAVAEALGEGEGLATASVGKAREALLDAFAVAHLRIVAAGRADEALSHMATTLIVAVPAGDALYTCHVGDVRGYRWLSETGELEQLTADHSVVGELVASGAITREQARSHPQRNLVTQALGLEDGLSPTFRAAALARGDVVLLCSDGFWETIEHDALTAEVARTRASIKTRAAAMVDHALAEGGHDNITVLLYEH
jgi:protein phosphatase